LILEELLQRFTKPKAHRQIIEHFKALPVRPPLEVRGIDSNGATHIHSKANYKIHQCSFGSRVNQQIQVTLLVISSLQTRTEDPCIGGAVPGNDLPNGFPEALLGLRRAGDGFSVDPRIPPRWPGFQTVIRHVRARFEIRVDNAAGTDCGVVALEMDGETLRDGPVPWTEDDATHLITARLGQEG
jgi:hypothetical protein